MEPILSCINHIIYGTHTVNVPNQDMPLEPSSDYGLHSLLQFVSKDPHRSYLVSLTGIRAGAIPAVEPRQSPFKCVYDVEPPSRDSDADLPVPLWDPERRREQDRLGA